MELTKEREQDHAHFRFIEEQAIRLKTGAVVVHQGEQKEILAEITRYLDKSNYVVWVCFEAKSRATEQKQLVVFRAFESVVVDTWATCKGECRVG
jgi:hypothetical protein